MTLSLLADACRCASEAGSSSWGPRDYGAIVTGVGVVFSIWFAARNMERSTTVTQLKFFSDSLHRLDDLAIKERTDENHSAILIALLAELEWLARLVKTAELDPVMFATHFGPAFLQHFDDHVVYLKERQSVNPATYEAIFWLEKFMRPHRHSE